LFTWATKQRCDVLHDDVAGCQFANKSDDFGPQSAAGAFPDACLFSSDANILARESPCDDINGNAVSSKNVACEFGNVFIARHLRPMFRKNFAGEWFNFAESHGFKPACPIKAKAKAPDPAKEIKDFQFGHSITVYLLTSLS
jgi:hypothetical protein